MKTSSFREYKGTKGVAICLYPPFGWTGPQFPALNPTKKIFFAKKAETIPEEEYTRRYREEVLSVLDPKDVYDKLKDSVLLCWEPAGEFCHRRIVAQWIFENLEIEVPEWTPDDDKPKNIQQPLF